MKRDPMTAVRAYVDFSHVDEKHREIHGRLENWARACHGGGGSSALPMFRLYRPDEHWEGEAASIPIDHADAGKIARGVFMLPKPHGMAIGWCYVKKSPPRKACQALGVTMEGLWLYVRDGRQMLVNRKV